MKAYPFIDLKQPVISSATEVACWSVLLKTPALLTSHIYKSYRTYIKLNKNISILVNSLGFQLLTFFLYLYYSQKAILAQPTRQDRLMIYIYTCIYLFSCSHASSQFQSTWKAFFCSSCHFFAKKKKPKHSWTKRNINIKITFPLQFAILNFSLIYTCT